MRQADLDTVLAKARETHPTIRWMGVLLDDGWDGASITGVQDGLSANETFGADTDRTGTEAIASVIEKLRELWS